MVCTFRRGRTGAALAAVLLLLMVFLFASVGSARAFSDVPASHPYADAIADLSGRQIINGYVNGTFGPANPTIRQQFAKMIVGTFGLSVSESDVSTFLDVDTSGPDSLYPDNYIAVAAANGITHGTSPGYFSPERRVSRAQAVTMAVRALDELKPGTLASTPVGFSSSWGDFSPDHAAFAAKAESNGLLAGLGADDAHPDGNLAALDPFGDMSRGEVAQLLHNVIGKLPPPPPDYAAIHDPDAALSATYAPCAGSACHELNLFSQHVVKLGLPCATCHGSSRPEVLGAITAYQQTGTKQGCRVCHGQGAGQHTASHELTNPAPGAACTLCHASNLLGEHVTKHQLACAVCHGLAARPAVAAVIAEFGGDNARNPACADCHATSHQGITAAHTDAESVECAGCHKTVLLDEHTRSSSSGAARECAGCHPLAAQFSWSGLCADCHKAGGVAPARHQTIDGAHDSSSTCANGGCHPTDLRVVHGGAPNGCQICHSPTSVPTSKECTSCHASAHPGLAAAHTANEVAACKDCHLMVLPDEHARSSSSSKAAGCDNCHPLPAGFTATKLCVDCHAVGKTAPARHGGIESVHVVSALCTGSSCHASDLRTLHAATTNGCKTCHSTSKIPTSGQCSSCHPTTPHVVRDPYKGTCVNCHDIAGPGEKLHDKHTGKGFACSECHGASAPGCANGSCHEHSVDKIHGVDDHGYDASNLASCTKCHKSGPPN